MPESLIEEKERSTIPKTKTGILRTNEQTKGEKILYCFSFLRSYVNHLRKKKKFIEDENISYLIDYSIQMRYQLYFHSKKKIVKIEFNDRR
jgi:hypothetical protein